MLKRFSLLLIIGFIFSCKTEEVIPVKPALVIQEINLDLPPEEAVYSFDLDSNGLVDFTLLVHEYSGQDLNKLIMRMQGAISTPFTTAIHADLRELNEEEQCNITYESILEPTIFQPGDTIGYNLELKWYFIGDFHHSLVCRGPSCACSSEGSDVTYIPIAPGGTGYLAVRFLRRQRKHFGWMEVMRSADGTSYTMSRVAYNRFYGEPAVIPF